MRTSDIPSAAAPTTQGSPLEGLLQQQARAAAIALPTPPAPGQVLLGRLSALPTHGHSGLVEVDGLGAVSLAHSLVPLQAEHIGQRVALSLMAPPQGPQQALLLGLLWDGRSEAQAPTPMEEAEEGLVVTVDGHREVIEAAEELELRCGEACIVLTADGRIQLRGTYITSHASATQRIVGGSVHVN